MRFFSGGKIYDFMRWSGPAIVLSMVLTLSSIALLLFGNPRLGTDFRGGTEVEVAFNAPTTPQEVRSGVEAAGFGKPDVIKIDDARIRTATSSGCTGLDLSDATRNAVERALCIAPNMPASGVPMRSARPEVKFGPGGDKVTRGSRNARISTGCERMARCRDLQLRPGAETR
jgi:preprotein translocase subunit SecF